MSHQMVLQSTKKLLKTIDKWCTRHIFKRLAFFSSCSLSLSVPEQSKGDWGIKNCLYSRISVWAWRELQHKDLSGTRIWAEQWCACERGLRCGVVVCLSLSVCSPDLLFLLINLENFINMKYAYALCLFTWTKPLYCKIVFAHFRTWDQLFLKIYIKTSIVCCRTNSRFPAVCLNELCSSAY